MADKEIDLFSLVNISNRFISCKIRLDQAEQILRDIAAEKINKDVMVEVCKTYLDTHTWEV